MKKRSITIDGVAHVFAPLLVATLEEYQEALGRAQRGEMRDPVEFGGLVVTLATKSLQRAGSSLTREQVAELVDMGNAPEFFAAAFGVTVPEEAPGESPAASP
jgi:hypothetical protein